MTDKELETRLSNIDYTLGQIHSETKDKGHTFIILMLILLFLGLSANSEQVKMVLSKLTPPAAAAVRK